MTRFLKLDRQDPYRLFVSAIEVSRLAISNAYYAAFDAYQRCTELLREHEWSQIDTDDIFEQLGLYDSGAARRPTASQEELQRMYARLRRRIFRRIISPASYCCSQTTRSSASQKG